MRGLRYILLWLLVAGACALKAQVYSGDYQAKSLAFVLEDFTKRYSLSFAYDSQALQAYQGSWYFEQITFEEVMELLLTPFDLQWKRVGDTYVIYPHEEELALPASASPGRPFVLYGEVRDRKTNELLPFATLLSNDGNLHSTTNEHGKFALHSAMLHDTIHIFYVGYEPQIFVPDTTRSHTVIHLLQRHASLPTITVESQRVLLVSSGMDASEQVINPNKITGIIGSGEADIYRAVQLLPGVNGTMENNNGLFVRGSNSDQTLITFDGFTLYQQDHFFGAFSAVNSTAVKNMRLHKGATNARFGGRVAGVLEIVGNEGASNKARAQVDIGPLALAALIETPLDRDGKASAVIAGRRSFTNTVFSPTYRSLFNTVYNAAINVNPDKDLKTFGGEGDPEFYFQDLNVKLTYRASHRDAVNLSFFASKDKLYMQYADTGSFEVINLRDVNYTDESVKRNVGAGMRWTHQWRDHLESLVSVGFSRFTGDFFSVDTILEIGFQDKEVLFYAENAILNDLDARAEVAYLRDKHRVLGGVQYNGLSTFNKLNYLGTSIPIREQEGGILSFYLQDEWNPHSKWNLRPGLRINRYDINAAWYAEPRLAVGYQLVPYRLRLKATTGMVHQYIHRLREHSLYFNTPDYWQFSGNDALPVLRSLQYTLGVIVNVKSWSMDVEGFLKRNTGLFINKGIYGRSDAERYRAELYTGNGTTYGLDALVQYNRKDHHAWVAYSLTYSYNAFDTETGRRRIREPYVRQHEAKVYHQWQPGRWSFSWMWVIGSGKAYTPFLGIYDYPLPNGIIRKLPVFGDLNSALLRPYHRMDVSAAYHFNFRMTYGKLQFSVFNVYNHENVRDIQYVAVRTTTANNEYRVVERKVNMLPFLPSINLQLQF